VSTDDWVVEWVDGATGEVTRRQSAAELADPIRYAPGADERPVRVTRIEIVTRGDRREIRQYAEDGTLLLATHQRREQP
jgi:hypothetical protein